MVQLCPLEEIVEETATRYTQTDNKFVLFQYHWVTTIQEFLSELRISGDVINTGSTHPNRLTYILEPKGKCRPYPPDIDISIVVDNQIVPAELEDAIYDNFGEIGSVHTDEKHGKVIAVIDAGDANVELGVYTRDIAIKNGEIMYNALIAPFSQDQKREARVLKLLLQRNGCYGAFNRGLNGITVDELIRQYGTVNKALEFFGAALLEKNKRILTPLGTDENLLLNVSPHVWERIRYMVETFTLRNRVKADPFGDADWADHHADQVAFSMYIGCAPASCGREGSAVAGNVRRTISDLFSHYGIKRPKGSDYLVIPCQGTQGSNVTPHTEVYCAINCLDGRIDAQEFQALFIEKMKEFETGITAHPTP